MSTKPNQQQKGCSKYHLKSEMGYVSYDHEACLTRKT